MKKIENKFKGALMGLAVGDALGATTEFMSQKDIKNTYGYVNEITGGGWLNLEPGEVTDDTEMTLCVARGIINNYKNPIDCIGKEFINWLKNDPKDVGISTSLSIRSYDGDWFEAAKKSHLIIGKSAGNGSLMRCLPISLAYSDVKKISNLSILQSKMTHYDDLCSEVCSIYNSIAFETLHGRDLKDVIKIKIQDNKIYKEVIKKDPDCSPTGYVVDTFKWVLRTLLTTNSFSEVVEKLANLGDDSDTTAAIAGGLAGIYYGYDKIDEKYKNKIIIKDEIESIAKKLYEIYQKDSL